MPFGSLCYVNMKCYQKFHQYLGKLKINFPFIYCFLYMCNDMVHCSFCGCYRCGNMLQCYILDIPVTKFALLSA